MSDLIDLYHCIFNWMEQNNGAEVLVVGGDLHFGKTPKGCPTRITKGYFGTHV